jgi:hypothetical protein
MSNALERNPLIDAYVLLAWEILRESNQKGERYTSVHTTWTPFNKLFRELFPGVDPVAYTKLLQAAGHLEVYVARGGALVRPCECFLAPVLPEHKETVARMKQLLVDETEKQRKRREERLTKQSKKQAATAWREGDTAAALKRLGY